MLCEISRETRGNREARRESGTREREESRGSDSRRERSEVSGAHHKTTIIRVRAGNRDASPSPRGSQLSRFSRFERVRVDVTVKPDRQFFSSNRDSQVISRLCHEIFIIGAVFSFFFFFFTQSVIRKSSIPCTLVVQEINIQVFLSVDKSRSHRSLVQGKDKKFIMEVRNR